VLSVHGHFKNLSKTDYNTINRNTLVTVQSGTNDTLSIGIISNPKIYEHNEHKYLLIYINTFLSTTYDETSPMDTKLIHGVTQGLRLNYHIRHHSSLLHSLPSLSSSGVFSPSWPRSLLTISRRSLELAPGLHRRIQPGGSFLEPNARHFDLLARFLKGPR
jgi:hypothetical protein